jgi:4-hydroxy-tetrahydrodipicolinate reductase
MESEIKVLLLGLGPMGKLIASSIVDKKGFKVVGAVDIAKELAGRDLGQVLEKKKNIGVVVSDDLRGLISKTNADIAVVMTRSHLKEVFPQVSSLVKAGINVISTCEELSYPYNKYPEMSSELDQLAKKHHVTVLGTGINPGYLMDTLPIVLTGPCETVKTIKVVRMMNSSKRRIPYQKKIGTGLTREEFRKMIDDKKITGHVGLVESISMIASALGWKLDEVKEFPPEPVIAEKEKKTSYTTIKPGQVAGLKSIAHGIRKGVSIIVLEFISNAIVDEEYDSVVIEGRPNVHEKIVGGVHGDVGTVSMIVNMIPKVINAAPGLVTMKDLPIPSAVIEDARTYVNRKKPV